MYPWWCTPSWTLAQSQLTPIFNFSWLVKKRDTNKCISLKYCFIHSYVGIIQIRLWVEVLNFLSAWYTSSPCFLHMISIKACLIDVNRFFSIWYKIFSHNVPVQHNTLLRSSLRHIVFPLSVPVPFLQAFLNRLFRLWYTWIPKLNLDICHFLHKDRYHFCLLRFPDCFWYLNPF